MFRFIVQLIGCLLFGSLLFGVGFALGQQVDAAPPIREFTPQPDMVSLQDPATVTDAFLLACTLEKYESAAWLVEPGWAASFDDIALLCAAVSAPSLAEERFLGTQQQTNRTAFVEWIWFDTDDTSSVAYFLLQKTGAIGWQIVGAAVAE